MIAPARAVTKTATYTAAQYNTHVRDNMAALWVYTTAGDIAYATGATGLARLGIGGAGALLYSAGSAPAWKAAGGAGELLYGAGAAAPNWLGIGGAGALLKSTGSAPAWLAAGSAEAQVLKMVSGLPAWSMMIEKCAVYKNSNQSFSSGSGGDIYFEVNAIDDANWHSTSVDTDRITVPAAGIYIAFACVRFVRNSGGSGTFDTEAGILANGSVQTGNRARLNWTTDANPKEFTFGGVPFFLDVNNYVVLNFKQNSGGTGYVSGAYGETMLALMRLQ